MAVNAADAWQQSGSRADRPYRAASRDDRAMPGDRSGSLRRKRVLVTLLLGASDREALGIEFAADPLDHIIMRWMFGIADRLEEIGITPDAAAIVVNPKAAIPADTMTSADQRVRARCRTRAPSTAPQPKLPRSTPYPTGLPLIR